MNNDHDLGAKIEATMARVEAMEPGGNLEALLEEESRDLKKALFKEAVRRRQTAARPADFSPCALPALPGKNPASDRAEKTHGTNTRR